MSSVTITYYSVRNNANILGNSMRNRSTTGKFSHGRVASGTGSRGDAAIIVQIKENVNSLSFASRVTPGNIQRRRETKRIRRTISVKQR